MRWLAAGALALFGALPLPAAAFDKLSFQLAGGTEELETRLRQVSILTQLEADDSRAPADVVAAAQGDYARLVEALYAEGYYAPTVRILLDGQEAADVQPFAAPVAIRQVSVIVDPGPAFTFGTAAIAPLARRSDATEGFAAGAPARATLVRSAAQNAVLGWRQAGHAKARIVGQEITARHREARLDVAVEVDPGPRFTFGDVVVTSQSAVKPARIRQIAGIPRGDVFDPDAVEKAAERLRAAGPFRSVTLTEAEDAGPDGTLDIEVAVTDQKPRRFGGGVELTSDEGLMLSAYWLHRNLFGGAERLRLDGAVRQLGAAGVKPDYGLSARFEKPAVYGPDTLFFATARLAYEDEPDYLSETAEVGLGVTREFSETLSGALGFKLSRSRVTDYYLPGNPVREVDVFSMPVSLTRDLRDDPLDPTEGSYIRIGAEPFQLLNGGEGGTRLGFDLRGYRGFGADERVVVAGRLQWGSVSGPDAADAPPSFLMYSGGGGTVRGQPYRSLDADYNGARLGGRSFLGVSAEVRVDVTGTIGVVGFADAGYIGPESIYDGSGDWHAGAGLGLRYDTPVGPVRVDIAGPVSGDTGDGPQLYIGIGQAF